MTKQENPINPNHGGIMGNTEKKQVAKGNETLVATCEMLAAVKKAATVEVGRDFVDFYADRLLQAGTQPTLMRFVEWLAKSVGASISGIYPETKAQFFKHHNSSDSYGVLELLRTDPRVMAMLITLGHEQRAEAYPEIDVPDVDADPGVALPRGKFAINIELRCLSPFAHGGDVKAGNVTVFRRKSILTDKGRKLHLPFYGANSFRHKLRILLSQHYLRSLDLWGENTISGWFEFWLTNGGDMEDPNQKKYKLINEAFGKSGAVVVSGQHEFRNMVPHLSILGGNAGNQNLSGRIRVGDFHPRCRQWNNGNIEVAELFDWDFLTRGENENRDRSQKHRGMITNTEVICEGAIMDGGIDPSEIITPLELSALWKGLELLIDHGYFGAQGREGHGKVEVSIYSDMERATMPYETYLAENKSKILAYLETIGALKTTLV